MSGCRTLVQPPFSVGALPPDLRISTITTDRGSTEPAAEGFISTVPGKGAFVPQLDSALVRGQLLRQVEEGLQTAVDAARRAGPDRAELIETLDELMRSDHQHA